MLSALTDNGRADVAYGMAATKEFPGWGYMLENGATTLWETWKREEFIYSHNHPMFGSVSEWFFKGLGGIQPAPDAVGFDKIIVRPNPVGDLRWAQCFYESIRGPIECDWRVENGEILMHIKVPTNAEALVYIPTNSAASVTESDKLHSQAEGVEFIRQEGDRAVFRVGSGEYFFRAAQ
jgi:alpha-L-rhamnosidase